MELIAAIRRSHSRESGRSGRSEPTEGTNPRHEHPPQDPTNIPGAIHYDDNESVLGSDEYIYPENYDITKNDYLGKILLDMAHDQFLLAKKCKLDGMTTNIHEICDNFNGYMNICEKQRQDHSLITQSEMEKRLINKKLSSHLINQAYHPPEYFSRHPVLTSVGKTSDILRLFPNRNNKFSGLPRDNLSLLEFLTSINAAQEQAKLSEKEFKQVLLSCTTGPAHQFLIDWMEDNDEDIGSTYHQLALRFDTRKTPQEAKTELFHYKAPKDKTLAQVESHIMSLAHRASSCYPPGEARRHARNLEACDTLIRCLPTASADLVRRVHGDLCTETGKPCSSTDLSRALHNLRHSIDADIRMHGSDSRVRGRFPIKNHKNKTNSYSSYGISTNVEQNKGSPFKRMERNNSTFHRDTKVATGQRGIFPSSTQPRRFMNKNNRSRQGPNNGPRRLITITGCSLCGFKNHNTTVCQNMRDNSGKVIKVHPVQGTCGLCPGNRKNTLHHPEALCPFRPNHGCLQGK